MTTLVWKLAGALVAGVAGLWMLFWSLERISLVAFDGAMNGHTDQPPFSTFVAMFFGLIIINFSVFYALSRWSRYLRAHPETRQLPVWLLFAVIVVAGAALLTGVATHSAYVQSYEQIPMDINAGFIAFQVAMGTLVLVPLVLLGVRWAPGYRPYVPQE